MGLFDFFRPRWRHSDVEVRAEAVRQMGAADADLLARILRSDGDVRVRRIALKKIEDAELLAEVAESDADEGLRQAAADKASELLVAVAAGAGDEARRRRALDRITTQKALAEVAQRASIEGVRRAALARIADEKALAEVARGAKEPAMRREAVARLADAALLRDVALADPSRDVALAALAKLSDREALEAVARRARCRPARDAAREKLAEVTRPETPAGRSYGNLEAEAKLARRRARQVQLCRSVEALGNRNDLEQAERELLHARAAWQELGALAGEDLEMKARFDKACERFEQRRSEAARVHEAHVAEARTQAQPEPRAEAGDARQRRIEEQAAALVARIALCENVEALQGEEIPAKLEEARAAWNRLGAPPPERKAELERRFVRACAGAARRFDQRQAIAGARERLAALVEEAEKLAEAEKLQLAEQRLGHLRKEWKDLEALGAAAGDGEALAHRFAAAAERLSARRAEEKERRAQEEAANAARLEELSAGLEALLATDERKQAEQALKTAQAAVQSLGPLPPERQASLRERFHAAREKLAARLAELHEAEHWKRWANVPRLEKLCARAEALLDGADAVEQKQLAQELKALQAEWKSVGPAPRERSEALWGRFKAACDQLHARLETHFQALDEERAANLARKEELCARVEALAALPEAELNWKEAAETVKKLQEEWKGIGPVVREKADPVWKRFRAACDAFFGRRKEHFGKESEERAGNLQKKEELVAKVEALANVPDGAMNWKETGEQIKRLQEEWKSIGPVPREQADAVWERFRGACDRFFERRKAHFDKLDEERAENLRRKEELVAKVEALVESAPEDRDAAARQVKEWQAEWKKIGPAPREQADAVWHEFRDACDRFFEGARREEAGAAAASDEGQAEPASENDSRFENKLPLDKLASLVQAVAAKEEAEPAPVEPPPAAQEPVAEGAPTNGDEGGA